MGFLAVVPVGDNEPGGHGPGCASVGGTTILERQVREALAAGATQVVVVGEGIARDIATRLAAEDRCWRAADARALARRLREFPDDDMLLFAAGAIIDERIVKAMVVADGAMRLAVFGDTAPAGAERLDSGAHWAGLLWMPARQAAAIVAELGEWDLAGTLVRSAIEAGAERLAVGSLPTYAPARRREVPMLWAMPRTDQERRLVTSQLLAAAQKGVLDWPARFIHPPIEDALVRMLLDTPVTPNMVTLFSAVLGAVGIICFASGWLWWGLAIALVLGPIDGVDGKLARVRHQFSRWGDLEHVLDKILEYGWFLALGWWFSGQHGSAAWLAAAGIIIFALVEALNGEFYRRFTGHQIDDRGTFERQFRLVAGRRNTFFWSLLPFAALGWWWQGFLFLLVYAMATFIIMQWRFLLGIAAYGRDHSAAVADNFSRTAYAFLPKAKAASR